MIVVVHENKHYHRVKRETVFKEIYILLHFYSQINEKCPVKTCAASVVECGCG